MSDFERIIMERLQLVEEKLKRLETEQSAADAALQFERLPDSATVGTDYVAYRFGCSEERVVRGKAGTGTIRRVSNRPVKFIKKEVDAAFREYSKTPQEKALELMGKAKVGQGKPRRSIIKRSESVSR